ncbi:MAG: hypothetical protein WDN46_23110 [Methylocella sp.]
MNEMTSVQRIERQALQVIDPVPTLDTARFEHMQRIAMVMAESNLIPDSLCKITEGEGNNKKTSLLPLRTVVSNCFLVVNQAVRWGFDPFAVAQCVSVVKGKLCYEGKLIAAVIESKLKIRLKFDWDDAAGDNLGITVSGQFPDEDEPRTVQGTVGQWKTDHSGSPWRKASQARIQLAYRGTREWGRLHAPSIMLGVYTIDEMDYLDGPTHSSAPRIESVRVEPARREPPPPPPPAISVDAPVEAKSGPTPPEPPAPAADLPAHDPETGEIAETAEPDVVSEADLAVEMIDSFETAQTLESLLDLADEAKDGWLKTAAKEIVDKVHAAFFQHKARLGG